MQVIKQKRKLKEEHEEVIKTSNEHLKLKKHSQMKSLSSFFKFISQNSKPQNCTSNTFCHVGIINSIWRIPNSSWILLSSSWREERNMKLNSNMPLHNNGFLRFQINIFMLGYFSCTHSLYSPQFEPYLNISRLCWKLYSLTFLKFVLSIICFPVFYFSSGFCTITKFFTAKVW